MNLITAPVTVPSRPTLSRLAAALLVVPLATAASLLLTALPAAAHASLLKMTPADGATVSSAPARVLLEFSEPAQAKFASVAVTGPSGTRVDQGKPDVLDAKVTQPLAALGAPGKYTVTYRVVSVDGHPVTGRRSFTFTPPAGAAAAGAPAAPAPGTASAAPAPEASAPAPASSAPAAPAAAPTAAKHEADGLGGWLADHKLHVLGGLVIVLGGLAVVWQERRRHG